MSRAPVQLRSKWPVAVCALVSFVFGYGVSFLSKTAIPSAEPRIQIADFRVFVQLIGNDLFVRDRRERSPGIRVRSSSGTVEGCAYLHQRAQDLGLFNGANLVRNPAFRLTSGSNQLADDWSIAGPVEAMTISGGQAMAALGGGRLWQRIQVRPGGRYLLYARVNVMRGLVNWSIADAERGAKSMGTIEPERISEVVSDVVGSQSGYLDIGFEVPSGGAFRVIDVIVNRSPTLQSLIRFHPCKSVSGKPFVDMRLQMPYQHVEGL